MEKTEFENSRAVRELVEFLRFSGNASVARQDVEIAASALFLEPTSFLSLYDLTSEMRVPRPLRLRCDFVDVRARASKLIGEDDMAGLAKLAGGSIPEECKSRIDAARRNPSLRIHYLASAADRFAHHVMDALRVLFGQEGTSVVLQPPRDMDIRRLADIPYLSELRYEVDIHAR